MEDKSHTIEWGKPIGRVLVQAVSRPGFEPGSGHVGFVVDKVELRQVSS
jgi:hypothetical protein